MDILWTFRTVQNYSYHSIEEKPIKKNIEELNPDQLFYDHKMKFAGYQNHQK